MALHRRLAGIHLRPAPAKVGGGGDGGLEVTGGGLVVDTERLPTNGARTHFFLAACRLRSGKVLLSCRRGKDKMGTDGNVVLLESSPGGVGPWSVICEGFQHTWDGVRGEVRGSALAELPDGRLLAVYTWHDASDNREAFNPKTPSVWFRCYSSTGGRTWADHARFELSHPETGLPMRRPVLAGGIVTLADGRLVICGEALEVEEPGPEGFGGVRAGDVVQKAFVVLSSDAQGLSFGQALTVARDPQDETYYWDQRVYALPSGARSRWPSTDLVHAFWTQ